MFDKKKTQLFEEPAEDSIISNDPFVDDFASCSNYKQPREIKDIFSTLLEFLVHSSYLCLILNKVS